MTQRIRARGWSFTINNDTDEDLDNVMDLNSDYLIFGFEKGKDGTKHIQGYVYFENARSFDSVKKMIPRAHLEISRGSPQQNYEYCIKEGDFYEFGDRPIQGERTDINEIKKN